ncbi:MAG: hypothetical protein HY765_01540 [Rhodomicrobium sp.]|nr:hypothetical protein [Rhodomicrobium sp.]
MVAFNNEIASADKIGLHLSEIGRIQNNAGSLLQFMAIVFAICIYSFNALVYPAAGSNRILYGSILAVNAVFLAATCILYLRCLTLSVGWNSECRNPKTGFYFLSTLSEEQIQNTLHGIVWSFRRGTYCFALCFFTTLLLICLVALSELKIIPV